MELTYDGDANTLRLTPASADLAGPTTVAQFDGILDVGEGGRLIGIEFPASEYSLRAWQRDPSSGSYLSVDASGTAYVQITDANDNTARSTTIYLMAEYNACHELIGLVIPRRGDGYEITYPSGNQ